MSDAPIPAGDDLDAELLAACRAEPVELAVIRSLLERGANANARSYHSHILYGDEMGPLHALGLDRDNPVEAMQLLLDAGADPRALSKRHRWTPLHLAAIWNHTGMVELLVAQTVDVDAVAKQGRSALTPLLACINANAQLCEATARCLLDAGADPNLRPDQAMTPLEQAADANNLALVRLLLARGADPNAAGPRRSALFEAVSSKRGGEVARALLEAGASVDARQEPGGRRPIHEALMRTQQQHLELLLEFGARLDTRDDRGLTPLMTWLTWLARETPLELVQTLLERGADPASCDGAGTPTLHLALRKGEARVVELLVAGGADPRQRDAAGQSALALARELNPVLLRALGATEVLELAPPTQLALQGLASGMELRCASGVLRAHSWDPQHGRKRSMSATLQREQLAWCLLHEHGDSEAICALLNAVAGSLGHASRTRAEIVADLRAREGELVARCMLELHPRHGPELIEAAVRAGYEPCRSDKEGFWLWRFDGDGFWFKAAGDQEPAGEHRKRAEELRQFFSGFEVALGRLESWQRHRLDDALRQLGYDSERMWLAAQAG